MEEQEFRRLLDLFPIVRSRDCVIDEDSSTRLAPQSSRDEEVREWQDAWGDGERKELDGQGSHQPAAFWEKLKLSAQKKVGKTEADRICSAFRQLHQKLVFEELSLNAAQNFVKSISSKQ
ncbi:uncharacterized protein LOC116210480 isoform X2 [Punica granatum]|uniref:Uncharacterized protein LOC116210480 isoform X2 n=2 Tax=Punica granatum TaxID=22663 RepID=A0A6P8E5E4_PUNGR|nr:uncharacterized protein LOC116210480 isoform X2 [Punica granatum]PKI57788.1 hypothetical protein CRG98_021855 [Punica granatum]